MNLYIMSVFDSKAAAFLDPFYTNTVAIGIRSFEAAANDPSHEFTRHPDDYTLFELGQFCQSNAEFILHPAPISHGLAITYVRKTPNGIQQLDGSLNLVRTS